MARTGFRGPRATLLLGVSSAALLVGLSASPTFAATFTVSNTNDAGAGSLRDAINQANASGGADTIVFDAGLPGNVQILSDLPALVGSVAIDMAGNTLDANGNRGLFAYSGTIVIENGTISGAIAKGGDGGYGGAGAGMGGALFVAEAANVTVRSVVFTNNSARGGDATTTASGGGGLGGAGGTTNGAGGGGGIGSQADGGASGANGTAGIVTGAASGGSSVAVVGGADGGGGAGFSGPIGGAGAGGGIGGQSAGSAGVGLQHGGDGGFGGGGGGAGTNNGDGGAGGFGGGGGIGRGGAGFIGGNGGYGGGGGASFASTAGLGGFGGGDGGTAGAPGQGGGGAGMGGSVFVMQGGSLTIEGTTSISNGSVVSGNSTNGGDGRNFGTSMFLHGSGTLNFGNVTGTATIAGSTFDETGAINSGYAWVGDVEPGRAAGSWGMVVDAGTGRILLSGTNRFSGGLTINSGTLAFNFLGGLGDPAGGMTINGGTLEDTTVGVEDVAHDITLGAGGATFKAIISRLVGNISGAGGVTFDTHAAGELQLWGTNTYAGGTRIVAGTLSAGLGSAIPDTSRVDVAAGAAFKLELDETIGSLAGGGTVQPKLADRTLTVGGDGTSTADFSGVLENNLAELSLAKSGAGTQTLSGTNTYTGATAVNGGTLVVDGSIATSSGLTVGVGATVGGVGFLPSSTINGTLAPGNSIGTINVTGNLCFGAGATYAVEVSPTDADRVNVTGTATLTGASVATTYAPGAYIQRQYTIVNATGGVAGTFAGLIGTAPTGFNQTLTYDANNAYLVLSLIMSGGGGGGSGPGPYSGLNDNQQAVAATITQSFIANGGILAAFGALDANGLTQVSGEVSTAAMGAGFDATGQFVNLISGPGNTGGSGGAPLGYVSEGAMLGYAVDRARAVETERRGRALSSNAALASLAGETENAAAKAATSLALSGAHSADDIVEQAFASRWMLWGAAYGGGERVGGNGTVGSNTLSATTWGVASGVTRSFDGGSIGFALGGAGTSFSLANGLGGGNATSFNAGIHGSVDLSDAAYVSGALAWGYHATRTTRNVPGDTLTGRFGAQTLSGRIEAGYRLDLGGVAVTPYGAAEATLYSLPAYTETSAAGGPFALAFGRQSQTNVRTELGARSSIDLGSGVTLTGRAAWVWNAQNGRAVNAAFAALPGTAFTVNGARPAAHAALIDLGIQAALTDSVTAKLTFTGEFSQNVTSYGASAKIGVKW